MSETTNVIEVPPYMDTRDVQKHFGLKEKFVWRLLANCEIVGARVGRRWKVQSISIIRYLKKHQNTRKEEACSNQ